MKLRKTIHQTKLCQRRRQRRYQPAFTSTNERNNEVLLTINYKNIAEVLRVNGNKIQQGNEIKEKNLRVYYTYIDVTVEGSNLL